MPWNLGEKLEMLYALEDISRERHRNHANKIALQAI